jgi:hypothetical protein
LLLLLLLLLGDLAAASAASILLFTSSGFLGGRGIDGSRMMMSVLVRNGAIHSRTRSELLRTEMREEGMAIDGSEGMALEEHELERRRRGLTEVHT